jgi:DUF1707 SHOCT-like domain
MNHIQTEPGAPVRASDAERDQAAEILRAGYAEGRLTSAELDERLAAVYAAKTRGDLRDLTGDLPGAITAPSADGPLPASLPVLYPESGTGMQLNMCLLLCLLFAFPPAGIAYLILTARRQPQATREQGFLAPGAGAAG